jgi:hypothetical protein
VHHASFSLSDAFEPKLIKHRYSISTGTHQYNIAKNAESLEICKYCQRMTLLDKPVPNAELQMLPLTGNPAYQAIEYKHHA